MKISFNKDLFKNKNSKENIEVSKILNNLETKENLNEGFFEKEPNIKSVITLDFFRHSKKEKTDKSDEEILLTDEGKLLAKEKSSPETKIRQSLAFGSPRKRTQETSMLKMAGSNNEITGNENFEELKSKLNRDLKIGSKIGIDKNLDFKEDINSEYYKEALSSFSKGNYFKYLVEESDKRAEELGDKISFTYTRQAQQIAKVIEKYLKILPRWSDIVLDNKFNNEKEEYSKTLERFLGTHQGITESFLAKVIEMTDGTKKRDEFVRALDNLGFDFVEGVKVYLVDVKGKNPKIFIDYIHDNKNDKTKTFEFKKEIDFKIINEILNSK